MSRTWKSRVGVLALTATMGIGLVGLASPAGAAKAATDACKGDGWKLVVDADNQPFKNQGACVSYAAQGNQPVGSCLHPTGPFADARITGPLGTLNNLTFYNGAPGSCAFPMAQQTLVIAADEATAVEQCNALGAVTFHAPFASFGYPVPNTWWICF